jgi:chemotaxis protein CheX
MSSAVENTCDITLVSPFVRATREVFETALGCHCRCGETHYTHPGHHQFALTSVVGLSGRVVGAIGLSTSQAGAFQILERMTGMTSDAVDELVRDVVGEMVNMIAGRGKRELSEYELRLGLPQVIVGQDYEIYSPRWAHHYWIALDTGIGPCTLDVGFDPHRQA